VSRSAPRVKKWVCTSHALQRIQERRIKAEELREIIESPDIVIPQGPKWIFAKTVVNRSDNQIAAVLLERKEDGLWVVLTVMVHFEKK
jgi:hypothetical protein